MRNDITVLSQYMQEHTEGRARVEVFKTNDGEHGCRFYGPSGAFLKDEIYIGKAEVYAENAAENYVLGIKSINES
jgi:hypothetical protein|tara:strand:- start:537 stop:761 length:225 start_codon:yes stop_codon:yes gene_type:complete